MSDIQDRYRLIAGGFDARVQGTQPDKWGAPSPCEDWRARDVVAHVVEGHRGVIAQVRGGEPTQMGPEDDPTAAWSEVYRNMEEIAADPEALGKTIQGPIGPMPVEQILGRFVVMDLLVHTWDLARAVGGDERLDEESVRHAYEGLKPMDAMIRQPKVFGAKLEAPEGADLQTQFLYFLGRRA